MSHTVSLAQIQSHPREKEKENSHDKLCGYVSQLCKEFAWKLIDELSSLSVLEFTSFNGSNQYCMQKSWIVPKVFCFFKILKGPFQIKLETA